MVSVELPPAVTLAGLNDAVVPAGTPLADRLTVCALPELTAVAIVVEVLVPCAALTLLGLALIVKLFPLAAGGTRQSAAAFENSFCTVYVTPSPPTTVPCWALQMSPISPLFVSYQASGGPITVARPISGSVMASTISCEATDCWLANAVPLPQPVSQPEPACMSGGTP